MSNDQIVSALINALPTYKVGMTLEHNANRFFYETVEEYLEGSSCPPSFVSEDQKSIACSTNELWELQWYPDTAVGSYRIASPTLAGLLEYADQVKAELMEGDE